MFKQSRDAIQKAFLLLFFFVFIAFAAARNCYTAHEALSDTIKSIENIDFFSAEAVESVKQIGDSNKIVTELKCKELFTRMSLEQLFVLSRKFSPVDNVDITEWLKAVIIKKREVKIIPEFNYFEKTLVGTVPVIDISCGDARKPQYIKDINPERFHFDYPELCLNFEKQDLAEVPAKFWKPNPVSPKGQNIHMTFNFEEEETVSFSEDSNNFTNELLWTHSLKNDMFLRPRSRLWNQIYEEPPAFPYYYKEKVYMQNNYRIFCYDAYSGAVLWNFTPPNLSGGEELLIRMSHIHAPEPSHLLMIDNNKLYAEINGSLISIDVSSDIPVLDWQVPLGQYTIASKPYVIGSSLFVALINRRGELWGVLFDRGNGAVLWDTYIGISTKVCPASELVFHDNENIYFISNRGITSVFDIGSGTIQWIYEYPMKEYSVADISIPLGGYRWDFIKTPYDTSLITVVDGILLFKPRDCKYVYACDKRTGTLRWHIDIEEMKILTYSDARLFFLKNNEIYSINVISGAESYVCSVVNNSLRGVVRGREGSCLFKVGTHIYFLDATSDPAVKLIAVSPNSESWLAGTLGEGIYFEVETGELFCFGKRESLANRSSDKSEPGKMWERLMRGEILDNDRPLLEKRIQQDALSAAEYTKLLLASEKYFKDQPLTIAGNKMCLYNDIYMRCGSFLNEQSGTNIHVIKEKGFREKIEVMDRIKDDSFVLAEGERLRTLNIKNVSEDFPFFLALKFDQLLCIRKADGEIIWKKFILGYRTDREVRPVLNKILSAALYGDIIVIFDGVNLMGLESATGRLVWTISNDDIDYKQLVTYQETLVAKDHAFAYSTIFTKDTVVHFRKGKLYFIRPETGYCYSKISEESFFVAQMDVDENYVTCFYLLDGKVTLYDYKKGQMLKEMNVYPLLPKGDTVREINVSGDETKALQLLNALDFSFCFRYPYCYFQFSTGLWCAQFDEDKIIHKQGEFSNQAGWRVAKTEEYVVSYNPLWKVVVWNEGLKSERFSTKLSPLSYEKTMNDCWQFVSSPLQLWSLNESEMFHFQKNKIFFVKKKNEMFYLSAVDCNTGQELWEVYITDKYPKLWHISNSVFIKDKLCLSISVKKQIADWSGDDGFVHTVLMIVDTQTGEVRQRKFFSLAMSSLKYTHCLGAVNDVCIINENDERLIAIRIP
ncbi:MAG: PQQ-binding-like beta-propeller repeat protein [Candidatus Omnitrophica bacterium]|nr:PQQ-binding-like beta-propeller repeat protein [Candidatus Omnitrophota bacterium]